MGRRMGGRLYFGPAYWYLRNPIPWFKWKMEKGKERRGSYCIKMKLHNGTNKANNPLTNPSSQQTPHKGLVHLKSTATLPHRLLAVCQLLLLLERLLQHLLLLSSRLHLTNPRLAHALHLLHLLLTQLLLPPLPPSPRSAFPSSSKYQSASPSAEPYVIFPFHSYVITLG